MRDDQTVISLYFDKSEGIDIITIYQQKILLSFTMKNFIKTDGYKNNYYVV